MCVFSQCLKSSSVHNTLSYFCLEGKAKDWNIRLNMKLSLLGELDLCVLIIER